jgi:hypothetical protein
MLKAAVPSAESILSSIKKSNGRPPFVNCLQKIQLIDIINFSPANGSFCDVHYILYLISQTM